MKSLNANWITEGRIDFEYKKYILLAYLQEVSKSFSEAKLYPFLSDLFQHHNNLLALKERKENAINSFPKKITRMDVEHLRIEYDRLVTDDGCMEEINHILDYAMPMLRQYVEEGKELYEFVEDKLLFVPIGVIPLRPVEGYLLLKQLNRNDVAVYEYGITLFENANEKYRSIRTLYVTTYTAGITNTFESIKYDLIKNRKEIGNPATYAVESKMHFPFEETFYPIARRLLMRHLGSEL